MSFHIAVFDVLDGKRPIEVVFKDEDEYRRFSQFYRESIRLIEDNCDYNDQQIGEAK